MIDVLVDLVSYDFLRRAVIVSVLTGVISGIIGTFVMLRGLSMLGDAISHAVVPGVAIAYLFGFNFFYGAVIAGLASALGIGVIQHRTRVKQDAAIAITLSSMFAFGVILISVSPTAIDLTKILFGNVLAVRTEDLIISLVVGAIVLVAVTLLYKEFLVSSFDETTAEVYGFQTRRLHYLLLVLLTLVTVASMQTVGVILVIALLITPAATAFLLVTRLPNLLLLSATLGAVSALIGMIVSVAWNLPSGPVIAVVAAVWFLLALAFSPKQGLVIRRLRRARARIHSRKDVTP